MTFPNEVADQMARALRLALRRLTKPRPDHKGEDGLIWRDRVEIADALTAYRKSVKKEPKKLRRLDR